MRFCFFERFLLRNGEFVFEKVESVCLRERIFFFLYTSIHPSIHPPSSTDQATRRLPLASQILVGRSISLTSTLGLNSNCQAQVSKISISANRGIFLSTLPILGHTHLDLFFIAPFYHELLPHLDQLIVLDLDMEFR